MRIERHLRYKLELEPLEYMMLLEALCTAHASRRIDFPGTKIMGNMIKQLEKGQTECVHE